ncbi:hypothetical protein D3C78_1251920 [compost metagenome]
MQRIMLFIIGPQRRVALPPIDPGSQAPIAPAGFVEGGIPPAHGDQGWRRLLRRTKPRGAVNAKTLFQPRRLIQLRVVCTAVTNSDVHAGVLLQINHLTAGLQAYQVVRISLIKAPQARDQPQCSERMGDGNTQ